MEDQFRLWKLSRYSTSFTANIFHKMFDFSLTVPIILADTYRFRKKIKIKMELTAYHFGFYINLYVLVLINIDRCQLVSEGIDS